MDENEVVTIEADFDIKDFKGSVAELTASLGAMRIAAVGTAEKITVAFGAAKGAVKGAAEEAATMKDVMNLFAENVKAVADALQDMIEQMEIEQKQDMWQGWTDNALNFISVILETKGLIKKIWDNVDAKQIGGGLLLGFGKLIKPIKEGFDKIDIAGSFRKAKTSITDLVEKAGEKLGKLGPQMGKLAGKIGGFFSGMGQSVIGAVGPMVSSVGGMFKTAFGALGKFFTSPAGIAVAAIGAVIAAIALLVANWDKVKPAIDAVWARMTPMVEQMKKLGESFVSSAMSIWENILALWNESLKPIVDWIVATLAPLVVNSIYLIVDAIGILFAFVADVANGIFMILDGVIQFVVGGFTENLGLAWEGVLKIFEGAGEIISGTFKGILNAGIWLINSVIALIYSTIVGVLNGLDGVIGAIASVFGEDWGFSVPASAPQIPYLAKGAVLPANKPFLAMVGDQRHGTNIEAPLATIQEAVALEMESVIDAMAQIGSQMLAEQRRLRGTVEGIELGDATIGQAAARYNHRMAIVRGG